MEESQKQRHGRYCGSILGRCDDLALHQLVAVDEGIARTIDNDSGLRRKRDLLLSISGVGENLADVMMAELPGPDVLRSSAEVVNSKQRLVSEIAALERQRNASRARKWTFTT